MFFLRSNEVKLSRYLKLFQTRNFRYSFCHQQKLPTQSDIVIAGGGVIGTSVAYHLAQLGWKNILLLEQGSAGCGTSWHAAGLCGSIRSTKSDTDNCLYGLDLYSKFEEEIGIGFKRCGSLYLAQTDDRALLLRKAAVTARQYGVDCDLVSAKDAGKLNPFIKTDDLKLGLFVPKDAVVNPTDLVQAYLKKATKDGATTYEEGVSIQKVVTDGYRVTSVETDKGNIDCDVFINCAGLWSRELGLKSSPTVDIPLHASEHFYIVTKPIENVHSMLPVTRDYDARTYVREWSGGLMCGGFEADGKPCFFKDIPKQFEFQLLQEDWEHFGSLMDGLLDRYPCLQDAEIRSFVNGPESFTIDSKPNVSKAIELENYYVACGMSSFGIVSSAGVGRAISEMVTYGDSKTDCGTFDLRRIPKGYNNKFLLRDRTIWSLRSHYEMIYPKMDVDSCRNVMNSPMHYLLDNAGAVWRNVGNWEVPLFFASHRPDVEKYTFGKPDWLVNVQSELQTCEKDIGVIDLSSKSKFNVMYSDSNQLDQFLSSLSLLDVSTMNPGDYVDNVLLSKTDGCQATFSLAKVHDNKYTLITSADQHMYAYSKLHECSQERKLPITIEDIAGKYSTLALVGPNVDKLLNELLAPPLHTQQVKPMTCQPVDIGYASRVQLVNHFMDGIQGWQLFIPSEFAQGLYQLLFSYGAKYNIRNIGHLALDSLRIQNMIPAFGNELSARTDPAFIRSSYTQEKSNPLDLVLLEIRLNSSENWPWGGEPVLHSDGHHVGNLTSVGYTQDDNKVLALTLANNEILNKGSSVNIQCGGDVYEATVLKAL